MLGRRDSNWKNAGALKKNRGWNGGVHVARETERREMSSSRSRRRKGRRDGIWRNAGALKKNRKWNGGVHVAGETERREMSSSRSRRRKAGGLHGFYVRSVSSFNVAPTTSSKSGPEPEPASRGTLGPSQPVPKPPSRGTFSPSHYVKPSRGSNQSVCTNPWCRFTTQWLRTKLDFYKDPCKDFYSYVCGTHKGPSQLTQTADLAAWMKNMDLDFNDEERLSNVEPLDMIVRCSLDLGVPAVVSLELQEQAFYQGKRVIKLDLSEKEKKWLNDRLQRPEHVNANDYARLLALYGVQPRRYTELAANLSGYEKELRNIINRNPEKDPRFVAINSIPVKFRKPYNAEARENLSGGSTRGATVNIRYQASVLSLVLFNLALADIDDYIPRALPCYVHIVVYADDIAVFVTGPVPSGRCVRASVQTVLHYTDAFITGSGMRFSPAKTEAMLLPPAMAPSAAHRGSLSKQFPVLGRDQ
ncbi:hypothetical protein HPB51_000603 [Rhipicephalus microplus]|uniref:Reverse transcriptase domain-containing protein n=1 Tax=Rhipicephalus microplus TaxID=6941 RepID=A0A9J6EVF9_RHIMP|nr:hypothetical protein HPB51_000603 [Rhipicephalus microplus]